MTVEPVFTFLAFLGSLGLIVLGLQMFNTRLLLSFGSAIRNRLGEVNNTPLKAAAAGAAITGSLKSYAGLIVLLMSHVNASLIAGEAAVAVALGAALGQVIPIWLLGSLGFIGNLSYWAIPALAVAVPLYASRTRRISRIGNLMTSFIFVLMGISLLKFLLPASSDAPRILLLVRSAGSSNLLVTVLGFLLGTLISFLTRSSDATVISAFFFAWSGWFSLAPALAMMFGSKVGVMFAILRSSRPFSYEVRTVSVSVVLRLGFGALLGLCSVLPMEQLVGSLFPFHSHNPDVILLELAIVYSLYSLMITILLLPLRKGLIRLGSLLTRKDRKKTADMELPVLPRGVSDSLEANLITTRSEIGRMADLTHGMLMEVLNASQDMSGAAEYRERLLASHAELAMAGNRVERFLTMSIRDPSGTDQSRDIGAQSRVSRQLVLIGQGCMDAADVFIRITRKELRIHDEAMDELFAYISGILDFLKYDSDYLTRRLQTYDRSLALQLESELIRFGSSLQKRVRKTLERDEEADIRGELQFMQIVRFMEGVGEGCLAIGVEIPKLR